MLADESIFTLPVAPAYYPHVRAMNHRGAPPLPSGALPQLQGPLPPDSVLIDPRPPHVFREGQRKMRSVSLASDHGF